MYVCMTYVLTIYDAFVGGMEFDAAYLCRLLHTAKLDVFICMCVQLFAKFVAINV